MSIFRQSRHPLVKWWWEMDRVSVFILVCIMGLGALAVTTASVAVAKTYSVGPYYFGIRHYLFLLLALGTMLAMTVLRPPGVRRVGLILLLVAYAGLILTFVMGVEVKGARRWISIAGQTIQPTEFLKPGLILVTAWLLSAEDMKQRTRGFVVSIALMALVGLPVIMQPNFGMALAMGSVWFAQVFLAGMPLLWLAPLVGLGLCVVALSYLLLPHIRDRLDRFLNPDSTDTYQIDQASEAIASGHLFGRGAGEGVVKQTLPDAHTDFIFAVLVEEFGILLGLIVMLLFLTLIMRGFRRVAGHEERFVVLAVGGLLTLVALHVCVNVGVALHLVPTTGMTLPFISYGGSSTFAMALVFGFLLALLRKQSRRI
jgi:cell division protein FtsW